MNLLQWILIRVKNFHHIGDFSSLLRIFIKILTFSVWVNVYQSNECLMTIINCFPADEFSSWICLPMMKNSSKFWSMLNNNYQLLSNRWMFITMMKFSPNANFFSQWWIYIKTLVIHLHHRDKFINDQSYLLHHTNTISSQ